MKRLAVIAASALALLVTVIGFGPHLINWDAFKPEIAEIVRDATGLDLRIDGDIELTLVPAIEFAFPDIHIANTPDSTAPEIASIETVEGRVQLWPIFLGGVVVDQIVIKRPNVTLEVNEAGATNWHVAEIQPEEPTQKTQDSSGNRLLFGDIRVDSLRIADGSFRYIDAQNDQALSGTDVEVSASLTGLDGPLQIEGRLALNDKPVVLNASLAPFQAAVAPGSGQLMVSVDAADLQVKLESDLQTEPLVSLDGEGTINVPSLEALTSWIDLPVDANPEPLKLSAQFTSRGPVVELVDIAIEGNHLNARATASLDGGGDTTRVIAKIEGAPLDIDRYLRHPQADSARPPPAADPDEPPGLLLDRVPDTPFDFAGLRRINADVDVAIDNLRYAGYAIERIRFQATAKEGQVDADLEEVALYNGAISGKLKLDASAETAKVQTDLEVDDVDLGEIAKATKPQTPPVTAVARGRFHLTSEGDTPRALVKNVVGRLEASIQSPSGTPSKRQLSDLDLVLDRASADAKPGLAGHVVYAGERVEFDATTDPLDRLWSGKPIGVDAKITSPSVTANYSGQILQSPAPNIAGGIKAQIPSVARFARWIGQPLPEDQADPGPIQIAADFESNGGKSTIEKASLEGRGLSLQATGNIDTTEDVTRFNVDLKGGVIDVDRFLPVATSASHDQGSQENDALASLSDEPIDVSFLRDVAGEVRISLQGLKVSNIETGPVTATAKVDRGVLNVQLGRMNFADGDVAAEARIDSSGETIGVAGTVRLENLETSRLEALITTSDTTLTGRASARVELATNGNTPGQLVTRATGNVTVTSPGIDLSTGPIAAASNINAAISAAGVNAPLRIRLQAQLTSRDGQQSLPFNSDGQLGSVSKLLAGDPMSVDLTSRLGQSELIVRGRISSTADTPHPELGIRLTSSRPNELGALVGVELPNGGPLSVSGTVSRNNTTFKVADLTAKLGALDVSGDLALALGGERPHIAGNLRSDLIDLSTPTSSDAQEHPSGPQKTGASSGLFPDDPLPLEGLQGVDANLTITIDKLRTKTDAEIDDVKVSFVLSDGTLRVNPFSGKVAEGDFEINLTMSTLEQPPRMDMRLQARQLRFGTALPLLVASGDSVGAGDIDIEFSSAGNSIRQLASDLNGRVSLIGQGGAVNSQLLNTLAAGLRDVTPFANPEGRTALNCLVADFQFHDGVGYTRAWLIDLPSVAIIVSGSVNLKDETIDLVFQPHPKGASLLQLAVPFRITGPISAPSARPDVAGTAFEVAKLAAVYFNPFAPFTAVAALAAGQVINIARGNRCVAAIQQARQRQPSEPSARRPTARTAGAAKGQPQKQPEAEWNWRRNRPKNDWDWIQERDDP